MNPVWLLLGLLLSVAMAPLGYWRQALSASGAVGAVLVGTLIFGLGGWEWGLLLVTFFASSSWLSHFRKADKAQVAEKFSKGNRRDIGQALANAGLGAILAVVSVRYPEPLLFAAFVGVMATVNADSWATELGILSLVPPRLITSGDAVAPGTSGGVTSLGIWASVAGAMLIGMVATASVQIGSLLSGNGWSHRAISYSQLAVVGGLVGSLFDSLLGATVQGIYYCDRCEKETESAVHHCGGGTQLLRGWGWLNNDLVNFLASLVGGLAAASLAWIVWR